MKILHINDQAGVACILAKYQILNNTKSKVLSSNEIDKFGILKFYRDYVNIVKPTNYLDYCISQAKDTDIIHIHSKEEIVVKMRKIFGNSKKIILHYHGTDIRGFKLNFSSYQNLRANMNLFAIKVWNSASKVKSRTRLIKMGYYKSFSNLRIDSQKLADAILVSTPDLLSLVPHAKYLPNPVDVEHFSEDNLNVNDDKSNKHALTIKKESGDIEKTLQYCNENNVDLKIDVFDRTNKPLLYQEIPHLLKKYNVYVDIQIVNNKIIESLSKTALESLACGLKVLNYNLKYIDKLPERHDPVNVINQLENIYNKLY